MIINTATRIHDDNDGDLSQKLTVMITGDGDLWIKTPKLLRFRAPFGGGGNSPKTWEALKLLYDAIIEDNSNCTGDTCTQLTIKRETTNELPTAPVEEDALSNNKSLDTILEIIEDVNTPEHVDAKFDPQDNVNCSCHTCTFIEYRGFLDTGYCNYHKKYLSELSMNGYSKFNCENWKHLRKI